MSKNTTIFLVILSTIFWGANFNVGKLVVEHLPPIMAATLRFSLGSVLIVCLVSYKETNISAAVRNNWNLFILLGIIGVAGFNGLFFYGLKYTTPVNGALIMATNPLVTLMLASFLLKNPIYFNQRVGIFFSLIGVMIVVTQGSLEALLQLKIATGDFIIMGANICWGLYGVLSRRYIKNSTPLITTASTMIFGTLLLIFFTLNIDNSTIHLINQGWSVYAAIVFMAIFGSVLAYLFWNYGIANLGAEQTAVYFNLVPVFTVVISISTGQPVSLLQIIGGLLVIFGVLISTKVVRIPRYFLQKNEIKNATL